MTDQFSDAQKIHCKEWLEAKDYTFWDYTHISWPSGLDQIKHDGKTMYGRLVHIPFLCMTYEGQLQKGEPGDYFIIESPREKQNRWIVKKEEFKQSYAFV